MNRFLNFLAAPSRLPRRFEEWCETPGHFEWAIRFCDDIVPVAVVVLASMLFGVVLTVVIVLVIHR